MSLWINNDKGLNKWARSCIRRRTTRKEAAETMLAELRYYNTTETPDGAKYTVTAILGAMRGME